MLAFLKFFPKPPPLGDFRYEAKCLGPNFKSYKYVDARIKGEFTLIGQNAIFFARIKIVKSL